MITAIVLFWGKYGNNRLRYPRYNNQVEWTPYQGSLRTHAIWGSLKSPIYPTFILGPALLNFGTRAVNLGHGLRHLHDKNKFDLFQCWFRAGTPEPGEALFKYWATGIFYSASWGLDIKFAPKVTPTDDQHNFSRVVQNIEVAEVKKKMADTRVQKAILWVLSSRKRKRNKVII